MRIGNIIILPWNKKNFILRSLLIGVVVLWLAGGYVLCREISLQKKERKDYQERVVKREERLRRQAAYQRRLLEEREAHSGVQNAVDGFKE
ncbi:MAG: hypothetical protein IKO35_05875 [Elusimicrobiaceae bacterium]|nr:hypothetical protein [Elusimicrobiaceae bacterium]